MLKYLVPMLLTSTSALADPISATVALISTITTASTAYIFGSALYHFAAVYALSELGKALAPDVPVQDRQTRGYEVAGVSPAAPHAVIYGRTKVGGVIVYKETTGNDKFLDMVIAIAGHEVDEIEEVYFDDVELGFAGKNAALNEVTSPSQYDGKAFVYRHVGTDDQLADPQLIQASDNKWTSSHTLSGIAYVYVKLEFDADAYPNGEPSISFVVRGKKLYNPTTQATTFSSNPAPLYLPVTALNPSRRLFRVLI
jgi:hypothetical protein